MWVDCSGADSEETGESSHSSQSGPDDKTFDWHFEHRGEPQIKQFKKEVAQPRSHQPEFHLMTITITQGSSHNLKLLPEAQIKQFQSGTSQKPGDGFYPTN